MEHRVGVRAELQRLGVAVAALIAREVREAAVGRRDELLGIGAEGPGAAEGAGELREPLLPALELLRCGGAVVAPEHPEHLAEGYTGDLIALALEGVQNPLVERGDAQRASHGRQTISASGEGGYLRREPRQLLPRRDGLRGQLRAHVGEGGIEYVARQHGAQQQIRIRRMLRQLLEYGRGDGGVTVAAAVEDRAHGAGILAAGVRDVAVGDEELDVRAAAMMSVLANTAQRLCQLALMRGEPAAAQRAVPDAPLAGRKRKSRNLGFLRIFGDFLCAQKVTRRRHGHADSPTNSPPKTHDSQPFTI